MADGSTARPDGCADDRDQAPGEHRPAEQAERDERHRLERSVHPGDSVAATRTTVVRAIMRPSARSHAVTDPPRIRLRDATLDDLDLLERWETPENRGVFNDFDLPSRSSLREPLAKGPLRSERNGLLIVERLADGRPVGTVSWHAVWYGPTPGSRAWNVGIALIPEARGQGLGPEAQRRLADEVFATTEANRVEASTDIENVAEQRALEKAGFVREGIQRGAQHRAGTYHDLVTYARLRDDP
jgi:RimJ/RimL family protein N-acetyltransferase